VSADDLLEPGILSHRRQHRHLDQAQGGKGYPSCGCCDAPVRLLRHKRGETGAPAFSCRCQNFTSRCGRCGRCPDHCGPACRGENTTDKEPLS
jgi:hypothetical protein